MATGVTPEGPWAPSPGSGSPACLASMHYLSIHPRINSHPSEPLRGSVTSADPSLGQGGAARLSLCPAWHTRRFRPETSRAGTPGEEVCRRSRLWPAGVPELGSALCAGRAGRRELDTAGGHSGKHRLRPPGPRPCQKRLVETPAVQRDRLCSMFPAPRGPVGRL